MNKFDLEDRLINFAVSVINLCTELENSKAGNHLAGQLLRSGTAPALNYGEAQSGEPRKDFVHKIKIVLKELRESLVSMKIIERAKLTTSMENITKAQNECNQLISIFVKSVETAQKNLIAEKIHKS